jgi:anti-anti-sigma regulatory factor
VSPPVQEEDWDLDFSMASTQPNGGYGIEVHEETDPFAEIAEHAAILYANGQDEAARSTLESIIHENRDPGAVKLWAMLFDLLRIKGDRAAFDALGLEFARICELSPPSWNTGDGGARKKTPSATAGLVVLQGVVAGDDPVFDNLMQALTDGGPRTLELGRLAGLDVEASAKLAKLLQQARRRGLAWSITSAEGLVARLAKRTVMGQAQEEPLWLLLLELYQYLGWEAQFEEKAVDYAVTFEVSPPSWEALRVPPAAREPVQDEAGSEGEAAMLEGEILQGNLGEVSAHLKQGEECHLDFSRVTRVDFVSAGALANLLKTAGAGPVVIYHPNRLVAELMRVMGVDQLARVELSKY